ncbi:hypothetical protein AAMO2058_000939300 [Amorphochlora amoebiformis]
MPDLRSVKTEDMEVNDAEIEAQAIQQLLPLLQLPEQLGRLPSFKASFQKQYGVSQAHLHSAVQTNNDDLRFAYEQIDQCVDLMKACRENLKMIDRLGSKCKKLLPEHEEIRRCEVARKNMMTTMQIIDEYNSIAEKAKKLMDKLDLMKGARQASADREIQNVYLSLRNVILFRNQLQIEGKNYAHEFRHKINKKFEVLNAVTTRLEEAVWDNVFDTVSLAIEDPTTLIYTFKIIEMEDRAKTKVFTPWDPMNLVSPMGKKGDNVMFAKWKMKVDISIDERLEQLQEEIVTEKALTAKLLKMDTLLDELITVSTRVVACCPPKYKVQEFYQTKYYSWLVETVCTMVSMVTDMSQTETLSLASWIQKLEKHIQKLAGKTAVPPELKDAVMTLGESYKIKSQDTLTQPIFNVFEMVKKDEPNEKASGKLSTFGPRDLFSLINNHFNSVNKKYGSGEAMIEIAKLYGMLLNKYQHKMIRFLRSVNFDEKSDKIYLDSEEKSEEFLCAWLSSGMQYIEVTDKLHGMVRSKLYRATAAKVEKVGDDRREVKDALEQDMTEYTEQLVRITTITKRGFRKVADEIVEILCSYVMKLVTSGEAFKELFKERIWMQGGSKREEIDEAIIGEISESLKLYLGWNEWDEYSYKLCTTMVTTLVQQYLTHLLNERPKINDKFLRILRSSKSFYMRFVSEDPLFDKVDKKTLEEKFELFDAFSGMFVAQDIFELETHFSTLITNFEPDVAFIVFQQILRLLSNISSKDKAKAIERYRSFGMILTEKRRSEMGTDLTRIGSEESGFMLDISFPKAEKKLHKHTKTSSNAFLSWFSSPTLSVKESKEDAKEAKNEKAGLPYIFEEANKEESGKAEEPEVISMADFLGED